MPIASLIQLSQLSQLTLPLRLTPFLVPAALAGALALGGCDDGGGGIDSGVAGNKPLSDLTNGDADKICDAAEEYTDGVLSERAYRRSLCAMLGLAEEDIASCRETQAACESDRLDGGPDLDSLPFAGLQRETATCFEASQLEGCDATVAELESCYEALVGQRQRELYAPRCESLEANRGPVIGDSSRLPVCETFQEKCPGLGPLLTNRPVVIDPPDRDSGVIIEPPPPPDDLPTCEELSLSFDGTDCQSLSCSSPAECDCDPFTQSYSTCNSVRGCLQTLDCEAACAAGSSMVDSCARANDCDSDADCDGYYCLDQGFGGQCSRGEPGDSCIDGGDCAAGSCASTSLGMRCVGDAADGSACDDDLECQSGICYVDFSVSPSTGSCSSGAAGEPCSSSDECLEGSCVYDGSSSTSTCSDGSADAPCDDDGDCDSGICAYGGRSASTCSDAELGSPCDSTSDCTSAVCETSATTGESTCGAAPGDECDDGVVDCGGDCRPIQGDCGSALCAPSCDGGSCSGEMLATWTTEDVYGTPVISGADLSVSSTSTGDQVRATVGRDAGQFYWEVTVDSLGVYNLGGVGVTSLDATLGPVLASSSVPGVVFAPTGVISNSAGDSVMGCGYSAGDVIGVALDLEDQLIYFSVNGVWQAGGSPDDADGGIDLDLTGEMVHPALELYPSDAYSANFGQSTFEFPPPSGFDPLY